MKYKVTTEPTVEPVTLDEAKTHLRVTHSVEDDYISSLISTARQWCEAYENTKYVTQTITGKMDTLPSEIELPIGPVQSITSLKYLDDDEVQQTVDSDDYELDNYENPAVLYAGYNATFPTPLAVRNAVEVVYVAGYGLAADVPGRIKSAIKLVLTHLYEHRVQNSEIKLEEMPMNAKDLLYERAF